MAGTSGRYAILEQFLADGVRFMFGNPGTVEQGFLDAIGDFPDLQYILTLQETIAVGVADGYARATKRPTIVQLHSGVGLGNGVGMMYQAKRGHAPLVVIAGESGVRYDAMDAQMASDLVAIAEPVTKWATRVTDPSSLLRVLRRATKIAATPPMGPVFVALPMDVLDAPAVEVRLPATIPWTRTAPEPALVAEAASYLAGAQRPMVIMGDGIAVSGAQAELVRTAELLGAEVWGADCSEVNFPQNHPQFRGLLGHMFGDHSQAITSPADAILICGTYVFPEVFPALEGVFGSGAKVVHIDLDAYEIGKNFPVTLGLVSDPKTTLRALAATLENIQTESQRNAAAARREAIGAASLRELEAARQLDQAAAGAVPMSPARFMSELAQQAPSDIVIFDEALTSSPDLCRYLPPSRPGHYFQTRGGSLGVGFPGAIGLKLAMPEKTVFGFSGDGGSMYTIQSLWTAAHHRIGAKFVVCNNQSYKLLKLNIQQYWRERELPENDFPASFDLGDPVIRFDELAHSMGVPAVRVETPEQVGPAIRQALADDGPFLIDLILTNDVPGHVVHVKCGQ